MLLQHIEQLLHLVILRADKQRGVPIGQELTGGGDTGGGKALLRNRIQNFGNIFIGNYSHNQLHINIHPFR